MALRDWASAPPPWLSSPAGLGVEPRALFTRLVRRRNFTGFPFWVSCSPEVCAKIAARAREFAQGVGLVRETVLADYSREHIRFFRERHWLPERPASFPGKREYKRLFQGRDLSEHALAGEVEHWTQIRVYPGLPDFPGPVRAGALPEREGPFCRAEPFGFLASNPVFSGTGLQVEIALHLPALTAARRMHQIQQALLAMGMEIQPLSLNLPGTAEAGFFRVVSRGGMKIAEADLYLGFMAKAKAVLKAESEAEERWKKREGVLIEDKVHRALRLLQEARNLAYGEFLSLASFARLGAYSGYFPGDLPARLEDLRVRAQPCHVAALLEQDGSPAADVFRAEMVRSALADVAARG